MRRRLQCEKMTDLTTVPRSVIVALRKDRCSTSDPAYHHLACLLGKGFPSMLSRSLIALAALAAIAAMPAQAQIALQNATATFSQSSPGTFNVSQSIDGITDSTGGWAIFNGGNTNAQTAVYETVANAGLAGGTQLTFNLLQNYGTQHLIGRFRLSATTDNRSLFADGLQTGGAVSANWTVLAPTTFVATNGVTLSLLGDNSILSGGTIPNTSNYTVVANTSLTGITGFRVEVLEDASLPTSGPGRQPSNGNFVLTEFTVSQAPSVAPEAGTFALMGVGMVGTLLARRRRTH